MLVTRAQEYVLATISVSLPSDGTTADVADYNTPITTIVSEFNGNIDNANIKSAAAIATSKIASDGGLARAALLDGLVRNRQGGTTGDNSWVTPGTSNTDTSAKHVVIDVGSANITANPTTVTFSEAFTQPPIVIISPGVAQSANAYAVLTSNPTTTTFAARMINDAGSAVTTERINWIAIGQ